MKDRTRRDSLHTVIDRAGGTHPDVLPSGISSFFIHPAANGTDPVRYPPRRQDLEAIPGG